MIGEFLKEMRRATREEKDPQRMITIKPRDKLDRLQEIANAEGVKLEGIEIVDDLQLWSQQHNIEEPNAFRAAKTVRRSVDDHPTILLAEEITPSMQSKICDFLEVIGFAEEAEQLRNTPDRFLVHLFLHELAHAKLGETAPEQRCDEWAFARLAIYAAAD